MPKPHPTKGRRRAANKKLPPAKYLRECFKYDKKTDNLIRRKRPRSHFTTDRVWKLTNTALAGTIAGYRSRKGYIYVKIDQVLYLAHRIIYKMRTGKEPPATIDHRDNDPRDNRRLRPATLSQQKQNSRIPSNNTSGYRGVSFCKQTGKWRPTIKANGKSYYFGRYDTLEEAAAVYKAAAIKLFGPFYRER